MAALVRGSRILLLSTSVATRRLISCASALSNAPQSVGAEICQLGSNDSSVKGMRLWGMTLGRDFDAGY